MVVSVLRRYESDTTAVMVSVLKTAGGPPKVLMVSGTEQLPPSPHLGQYFTSWEMVNHSKFFKDPTTGVNTNRIEGIWKHMKATMPGGSSRSKIEEYVQLFSFKEFCKTHPQYKQIGFLGLLSRANSTFNFVDNAGNGDHLSIYNIANEIVAANPLPEPEPSIANVTGRSPKKRGRPRTRKGRARWAKRSKIEEAPI